MFFGPIGKTRWPPRPLICWDIFDFSVETTERNSTNLDRKQDLNALYQVCVFRVIGKTKWPPGLWLAEIFSTSSLKPLNRIQRNLTGSKISTPSTKFVFFGPIGKTRWPPWSLIGWDIFDFSSETTKRNSTKLDRKQDLNTLYQVCVFRADRKNKMAPWPLIDWDIFDFSSETAEQNSTKLDRKQDLNALYQVCVFRADRKNKMAALVSDWLRHFRLLLWKHWMEFNETWQEARSQHPLLSLCFSGRSEKQDGRPGLWLAETFSTSPLKPLNGIQRNLTGSKILTPSTKFVFFGPIGETGWPPWPLICWDIFDFSSETAERNSTKLYRKQDLKALYQVCVFRADRKNKMAAPASDLLRHFWLLCRNHWTEFNKSWQEARSQRPLPSLCFSGDRKNKMAAWPLIGWDIFDFVSETAEQNSTKLDGKQDLNALYQVCVFRANRKNKMAALVSDWLRHFRLLLWNHWTEFNETWQEARSQHPLPSLCFSGRSEKQDGPLASDWLRHFRLLLWNRWTEFNETWQVARS